MPELEIPVSKGLTCATYTGAFDESLGPTEGRPAEEQYGIKCESAHGVLQGIVTNGYVGL